MIELCCEEADIATSSSGWREGINKREGERGKWENCAVPFSFSGAARLLSLGSVKVGEIIVPVTIIVITQVFSI